jgi:putative membrane protein
LDSPNAPEKDPRIYFAAERTLLAWIRTGLALMGFGFVVARFGLFLRELLVRQTGSPHASRFSLGAGTALIGLGVLVNLMAAWNYARTLDRLKRGSWEPPRTSIGVVIGVILALFGAAMVVYLLMYAR